MYIAFPYSEYYGSSDFSKTFLKLLCIRLALKYPFTCLDATGRRGSEISLVHSSVLFMHARLLDPAGPESPLR